jgi:D-glycero-D-manno-heptose 1,7-bisphosphate phosphatase
MENGSGRFIDAEGVWCQSMAPPSPPPKAGAPRPALFLDRDGVVLVEVPHLSRVEDTALVAGAAELIAAANRRSIPVVIVTNQGGISLGLYGWREFAAVEEAMLAALAQGGAHVDAVYASAHHPDGRPPYAHANHPARKPNPGMLFRARDALGLALERSWLLGDKASDIEAARNAGCAGALHVLTGWGPENREQAAALARPGFEVRLGASIADARDLLPLLDLRAL